MSKHQQRLNGKHKQKFLPKVELSPLPRLPSIYIQVTVLTVLFFYVGANDGKHIVMQAPLNISIIKVLTQWFC